jgi:hypothetical protein
MGVPSASLMDLSSAPRVPIKLIGAIESHWMAVSVRNLIPDEERLYMLMRS